MPTGNDAIVTPGPFPRTWRTRDGRDIPITELDDDHLDACIEYMGRKPSTDMNMLWIAVLKRERERRAKTRAVTKLMEHFNDAGLPRIEFKTVHVIHGKEIPVYTDKEYQALILHEGKARFIPINMDGLLSMIEKDTTILDTMSFKRYIIYLKEMEKYASRKKWYRDAVKNNRFTLGIVDDDFFAGMPDETVDKILNGLENTGKIADDVMTAMVLRQHDRDPSA